LVLFGLFYLIRRRCIL